MVVLSWFVAIGCVARTRSRADLTAVPDVSSTESLLLPKPVRFIRPRQGARIGWTAAGNIMVRGRSALSFQASISSSPPLGPRPGKGYSRSVQCDQLQMGHGTRAVRCRFWLEDNVWNGTADDLPIAVCGHAIEEGKTIRNENCTSVENGKLEFFPQAGFFHRPDTLKQGDAILRMS